MTSYEIQSGTVLEGFEAVADWTVSSGSVENDTAHVKEGFKSLKVTSDVGTSCIATKTISANLSRAGNMYVWVYIPVVADISSLQIILSDSTDFSTFFTRSPSGSGLHEGWNKLLLSRDTWTATGSTPSWSNTMVRLRVRVNASSGATAIVYFDGLYTGYYSRPKCIVTFDDGWLSQYTYAYPYMRNLGFRGTNYIIPEYIDVNASYQTSAQLQEMYDFGWDICVHDSGNWEDDYQDTPTLLAQIEEIKAFILSHGWSRNNSHLHAAYPQGAYNRTVLDAMAQAGMLTGRTIINRTQANEIDEPYY